MTDQIVQTLTAVVVSIAFCLLYFAGSNFLLDRIISLPVGSLHGRELLRSKIRPWLFLTPALLLPVLLCKFM